jgi:hypothetical protein
MWYDTALNLFRLLYGACLERQEKPGKTSVTSQTLVVSATA